MFLYRRGIRLDCRTRSHRVEETVKENESRQVERTKASKDEKKQTKDNNPKRHVWRRLGKEVSEDRIIRKDNSCQGGDLWDVADEVATRLLRVEVERSSDEAKKGQTFWSRGQIEKVRLDMAKLPESQGGCVTNEQTRTLGSKQFRHQHVQMY